MLFNPFVLVFIGFVSGQNLRFEDCDNSIACERRPAGCTSFETCAAVGMYFYNQTDNMFHFQLTFSTNNRWAAFAQNTLQRQGSRMTNLRGFYCREVNGNVLIDFLEGSGLFQPAFIAPDQVPEVSDVMTKTENGIHTCSFKRAMTIQSANGQRVLYNLDQQTDLIHIMADGPLNGNVMAYHGGGNYQVGAAAIANWQQFTGPEPVVVAPTASMVQLSPSSMMSTSIMSSRMTSIMTPAVQETKTMVMSSMMISMSSIMSSYMMMNKTKVMVTPTSTSMEYSMMMSEMMSMSKMPEMSKMSTYIMATPAKSMMPPSTTQSPNNKTPPPTTTVGSSASFVKVSNAFIVSIVMVASTLLLVKH